MTRSGVIAEDAGEEVAGTSGAFLLGRDREQSELYALVDGIEQHGGALVVRGDAGIGKSALLAAARERALSRGYLQPAAVRRLVAEHSSGQADRAKQLWALLSLELWHQAFFL